MGHRIVQDAVNTFKEVEITFPLISQQNRRAIAIKMIYWDGDDVQLVPGSYGSVTGLLSVVDHATYAAEPEGAGQHNKYMISNWSRFQGMRYKGTSEYIGEYEADERMIIYPEPGFIVISPTIWLGINTVGMPGVALKTVDVVIYYEYVTLTDDEWQELENEDYYWFWRDGGKN
jgi:hypothetical protein